VALRPCLFMLEPLARLLEPLLLGLLGTLLLGALGARVVCWSLGHGSLLHLVASPRFSVGGDHDPFFMWFQALSRPFADLPLSMAASCKDRKSQIRMKWRKANRKLLKSIFTVLRTRTSGSNLVQALLYRTIEANASG
jgi:hypothetical protein